MPQPTPFPPLACVVLAAGQGTRMKSEFPKVLHPVAGAPMLWHVLHACETASPESIVVVVGPNSSALEKAAAPHPCVVQKNPLGTGDAVKAARKTLADFSGDVIVLFGDGPLITTESLRAMQRKRKETGASVVVAGFSPENPASYGRLVIDETGNLSKIVEASEATPEENAISLCNGGVMLFDAAQLWPLLDQLRNGPAHPQFLIIRMRTEDSHVHELPDVNEIQRVHEAIGIAE